ncbi:uncharacterized protein C2845_PM03G03480 [Panicum miliaceum]|uniref:Uncharacterized protein n=1 Tax=Panicum miliaceum TaxID=4540 RepID=A0A3L6TCM0_PANMI|nr:uncharacterized protein C2845_PM03G03480 [Panicum miliaceum]
MCRDEKQRLETFGERTNGPWEVSGSATRFPLKEMLLEGFNATEEHVAFVGTIMGRASDLQSVILKEQYCQKCAAIAPVAARRPRAPVRRSCLRLRAHGAPPPPPGRCGALVAAASANGHCPLRLLPVRRQLRALVRDAGVLLRRRQRRRRHHHHHRAYGLAPRASLFSRASLPPPRSPQPRSPSSSPRTTLPPPSPDPEDYGNACGDVAGEWILFTSPTPFNRCVLLRCPSVSFEGGGVLLDGVNEHLLSAHRGAALREPEPWTHSRGAGFASRWRTVALQIIIGLLTRGFASRWRMAHRLLIPDPTNAPPVQPSDPGPHEPWWESDPKTNLLTQVKA